MPCGNKKCPCAFGGRGLILDRSRRLNSCGAGEIRAVGDGIGQDGPG